MAGRKKLAPAEPGTDIQVVGKTPPEMAAVEIAWREEGAKTAERANEVITRFGDGMPYVREHYLEDLRYHGRRNIDAMLTMGRRLVVMREMEPHGEWLPLLAQAGIDDRYARRLMLAAHRVNALPNRGTSPDLGRVIDSQSKFFALLSLPEEEFVKLATEGDGGGITLDEVKELSVRELKKALKDAELARNTAQAIVDEQAEQIAKLQKHLPQRTPDTDLRDMLSELGGLVLDVQVNTAALLDGVQAITQHADGHDLEYDEDVGTYVLNAIRPMIGLIADLRNLRGIDAPARFALEILARPGVED